MNVSNSLTFFVFLQFLQLLFLDGGLHSVYDVTIAYPDQVPEKEKDLVEGKLPKQVHFHIKRYFLINSIGMSIVNNYWSQRSFLIKGTENP